MAYTLRLNPSLRYRTLTDRLLRLRLVPLQRSSSRSVSYEFMNRQMVWHAFTVCFFPSVLFEIAECHIGISSLLSSPYQRSSIA